MMLEEFLVSRACKPTIFDLLKRNIPFIALEDGHIEWVFYPSEPIMMEHCGVLGQCGYEDHHLTKLQVVDWFENENNQNIFCACDIASLMSNGCICGFIKRWTSL